MGLRKGEVVFGGIILMIFEFAFGVVKDGIRW